MASMFIFTAVMASLILGFWIAIHAKELIVKWKRCNPDDIIRIVQLLVLCGFEAALVYGLYLNEVVMYGN